VSHVTFDGGAGDQPRESPAKYCSNLRG